MLNRMIDAGRRHVVITVAATALLLGSAGASVAQPGPAGGRGGPRGPGGPGGGLLAPLLSTHVEALRGLELTDAQREQVRSIMESHKAEVQAIAERGRSAFEALNTVTRAATDEAAIRQQGEAVGTIVADAAVLRARVHTEVWGVLTAEQQAKAEQLRTERETRIKERRGRMQQRMQQRRQQAGAGKG